jgi:hypothetical protein
MSANGGKADMTIVTFPAKIKKGNQLSFCAIEEIKAEIKANQSTRRSYARAHRLANVPFGLKADKRRCGWIVR